ncbi:MAG: ABC transporter substrate-binding protein [Caldilineaceae bacterium]
MDEFAELIPNIDEIEWKVIPEASTRTAELIAGNVDIITNVPPDQHAAVDASGEAVVEGGRQSAASTGFNQRDIFEGDGAEAIKQTDVRGPQYAVDVPTICQTLLAFDCERATSMVNPPIDNPNLEPYPYDPAMAEELLDAAGYPVAKTVPASSVRLPGRRGPLPERRACRSALHCPVPHWMWASTWTCRSWTSPPSFTHAAPTRSGSALPGCVPAAAPERHLRHGQIFPAYPVTQLHRVGQPRMVQPLGLCATTTRDVELQKQLTNEMLEIFYNDPPWLLLYFQPDFYGVSNDRTGIRAVTR